MDLSDFEGWPSEVISNVQNWFSNNFSRQTVLLREFFRDINVSPLDFHNFLDYATLLNSMREEGLIRLNYELMKHDVVVKTVNDFSEITDEDKKSLDDVQGRMFW